MTVNCKHIFHQNITKSSTEKKELLFIDNSVYQESVTKPLSKTVYCKTNEISPSSKSLSLL